MFDVTPIKNYLLFLKKEHGLRVSLHPMQEENIILPSELAIFNLHDNSYCIYLKSFPRARKHCVASQKKLTERCRNGALCGTCHAGVHEYVYPLSSGQETIGFISVSGYQAKTPESYLTATAEKFAIPHEKLCRAYAQLKKEMPPKDRIDTLIAPLCQMLELAYLKDASTPREEEQLIDRILRYVKKEHTQDITLEQLCHRFSYSRSHISHLFKKSTGKSFREYLTEVRLADAKWLLLHSHLGINEIAYSVGFGDGNYFSAVFKERVGISPRAYRQEKKTRE